MLTLERTKSETECLRQDVVFVGIQTAWPPGAAHNDELKGEGVHA